MGNCRGRLTHEETTGFDVRSLTRLDQTNDLHMIGSEEYVPSVDKGALGNCSCAKLLREKNPEYTSARTEAMMRSKSEFSSDANHEIGHSKVHWSEVRGLGDGHEDSDDEEAVMQENFEIFEKMTNDPRWTHLEEGPFFGGYVNSQDLGRKIAEGGQAEIFEWLRADGNISDDILLKVFKKGSRISQLRQQWPSKVLQQKVNQIVYQGFIIEDGRFAFGMVKCWGDLRKLIDQAMQAKNNQGPPFPFEWNGVTLQAIDIMESMARNLRILHKKGVVHKDMKASNIFLHKDMPYPHVIVADFECSVGVVGTGFWRAPEILLSLKNKDVIDFSEKVDVYGFAMTCFEVVTGLLPFEGELEACTASYDLVIKGQRPKLPRNLDMAVKRLIVRCWNPNPRKRPTFTDIWRTIYRMTL